MSYNADEEEVRSEKEDALVTQNIRKFIENEKYILLHNIASALKLTKDQNNEILTIIMRWFWLGKFNFTALSQHSSIMKEFGVSGVVSKSDSINRESFRFLLSSEITGKKRTQKRPDLISDQFGFKDADDKEKFYDSFLIEEWSFYQKIINKQKRDYRKAYLDQKKLSLENQIDNQIKAISSNTILYNLDSLAIEINDLIAPIHEFIKSIQKSVKKSDQILVEHLRKVFSSLPQCLNSQKTRKGHQISNAFIFARHMEIKRSNPRKIKSEIAKDIYKKYFSTTEASRVNSPERIRVIIYEQTKREIKKQISMLHAQYKMTDEDIVKKLSGEDFISPKFVRDALSSNTSTCKHTRWLVWDELSREFR